MYLHDTDKRQSDANGIIPGGYTKPYNNDAIVQAVIIAFIVARTLSFKSLGFSFPFLISNNILTC